MKKSRGSKKEMRGCKLSVGTGFRRPGTCGVFLLREKIRPRVLKINEKGGNYFHVGKKSAAGLIREGEKKRVGPTVIVGHSREKREMSFRQKSPWGSLSR